MVCCLLCGVRCLLCVVCSMCSLFVAGCVLFADCYYLRMLLFFRALLVVCAFGCSLFVVCCVCMCCWLAADVYCSLFVAGCWL